MPVPSSGHEHVGTDQQQDWREIWRHKKHRILLGVTVLTHHNSIPARKFADKRSSPRRHGIALATPPLLSISVLPLPAVPSAHPGLRDRKFLLSAVIQAQSKSLC